MYTGLLHTHSTLRWLIFGLVIYLLVKGFSGRKAGGVFTAGDQKAALFLLIFTHLQALIGFYEYLTGPYGIKLLDTLSMGEVMKSPTNRFFLVEHVTGMLIAIILITVGYSRSKRATTGPAKWNALYWPLFFALVLLLITIPWPFREVGAGRSWLPGM